MLIRGVRIVVTCWTRAPKRRNCRLVGLTVVSRINANGRSAASSRDIYDAADSWPRGERVPYAWRVQPSLASGACA